MVHLPKVLALKLQKICSHAPNAQNASNAECNEMQSRTKCLHRMQNTTKCNHAQGLGGSPPDRRRMGLGTRR